MYTTLDRVMMPMPFSNYYITQMYHKNSDAQVSANENCLDWATEIKINNKS